MSTFGLAVGFFCTQMILRYRDNKRYIKTILFWNANRNNYEIDGFPDSTYSSEREKANNDFLNAIEGRKFHTIDPKTTDKSASKSLHDD